MPNTIAQNLARLVAARTAIANAIINKGGTVNEGDGFEEFPDDIASIMPSIKVYGYHIDPEESDPDACVTYLRDSVGMTPASMGTTTFDYGSWKDTFFMPRPCMMKYNGTLDYYLDENDYKYKANDEELTGTLPLTFNSRVAGALKDYRVYGDDSGSGVETENLFDSDNVRINKRIGSGGEYYTDPDARYVASERIECSPSTNYSRNYPITLQETIAFYDADDVFILRIQTGNYTCTSPSNAKYMRTSILEENRYNLMLVQGSTSPTTYIPFGYKIPIIDTSGVTENILDPQNTQSVIIQGNTRWGVPFSLPAGNYTFKAFDRPLDTFIYAIIKHNDETFSEISYIITTNAIFTKTLTLIEGDTLYIYNAYAAGTKDATIEKMTAGNIVLVSGSTAPDHYIPHRYTADYNLYIGSTKLGEEEYLDYQEQKMYKRTENLFDKNAKDINNGYIDNGYINSSNSAISHPDYKVTEYIQIQSETNYTLKDMNVSASVASVCFYSSEKNFISGEAYQGQSVITFTTPQNASYLRFSYYFPNIDITMLVLGSTAPQSYIPYLQPTDPPVPLPAINAYKGENTLSSTETVGNVTIPNSPLSDISNPLYEGNAMMQWPKIYYKYEQGTIEGEGYFYCSNRKIDDDYNCYCNIDSENNEIDYFYTAIYNGTSAINYSNALTYKVGDWAIYNNSQYKAIVEQTAPTAYSTSATYAVGDLCTYSGKRYECNTAIETAEAWTAAHWTEIPNSTTWDINNWTLITNSPVTNLRSLSGVRLAPTNGNGNTTGTTEVTRATANNTHTSNEWYIDTLSDRMLINSLLILISKSLNSQAKFGNGISGGGQTQKESYITGTLDDKGLFYGSTTSTTTAVKVFGMENWYSCVWRRTAGLLGTADNTYSYKLTYNNYDGSTATSYNSNGTGYLIAKDKNGNNIIRPANTNSAYWFNKAAYGPYGYLPITLSTASSTTYYCDYYYNGSGFLLVGGNANNGTSAGFSGFRLYNSFADSYWFVSAALSLKPLAPA